MDEFIGTIKMFAGNFAPQGWMFCQGQTISISQYTALYSIKGNTYGGDAGRNSFKLPDLRGRVPVGAGELKSEKLLTFNEGETVGEKEVVLNPSNMPKLQATAVIKDLKAVAKGVIEDTIKPVINIPCSDNSADSNNPKGKYIGLSDAENLSGVASLYGNTANTFMKPFENSSRVSIKAELPVVTDGTPTVDINIGTPTPNGIPTYQPSLGINFIICVVGVYPTRP